MHALTNAYIHVYVLIRPRIRRGGVYWNLNTFYSIKEKTLTQKKVKRFDESLPRRSRGRVQLQHVIIN